MVKRLGRVIYWTGCGIAVLAIAAVLLFLAFGWFATGGVRFGALAELAGLYGIVPAAVSFGIGRAALYVLADE